MSGNGWCPVAPRTVGPGAGPVELTGCEARGVNADDDVVLCRMRVRNFRHRQSTDTGFVVGRDDRLHENLTSFRFDCATCRRGGAQPWC